MNIALFASAFYPHVGGVEEHVRQSAHAYQARGIEAIVITNRWPRDLPEHEIYEGIPLYRLALRVPENDFKTRVNFHLTHKRIRRAMLDILKKHDIDLLHVHCVSSNAYYALLARESLGLPLVTTTHGERTMWRNRLYLGSHLMEKTLRETLARSDFVTACSRDTLRDMEEFQGQPFAERGRVVYNGVRLDEFEGVAPFSHDRPYVLALGRLIPKKGFDILLRAWAQAQADDAVQKFDLLLAGDGPERGNLESLARELRLDVHFLGRADRPKTVSLFKGCAFFVLPSRLEPMGIVNLEAMAAGRAILASNVGGVPEIVYDDENGILFPSENIEALARELARLCGDEALRNRLGLAGLEHAQRFSWPSIAAQYLEIYDVVRSTRMAAA